MGYIDDAFTKLKSNMEITRTEEKLASQRHTTIREYVEGYSADCVEV